MKEITGCKTHSIKNGLAVRFRKLPLPHGCGKDALHSQESRRRMNEVGETTGESTSNRLSLTINQTYRIMKRISLHLTAFAVLLPCVAAFTEGNIWVTFCGFLYLVWLWFAANETERGKRFLRDYYREILRLERML